MVSIIKNIKIGSQPSISVDYIGQGEMVIFLHGIGGNKKNWEGNLPFFSKKFLSVAWDTRGYGESEDYSGDFIFEDILDDLKRVLDYFDREKLTSLDFQWGDKLLRFFMKNILIV